MAYRRKYARYRSSYRRGGKYRYSMYKLYKNRSSKAQSRQIYGLNKKLKWIQRLTKPEVKIAPLVQGSLLSSTGGTLINGVRIFPPIELTNLRPQGSDPDAAGNQGCDILDGRFARLQNLTIKGVFSYVNGTTVDLDPVDLQRMLAYMRIVIIQTKTSRGTVVNTNDLWSTTVDGTTTIEAGTGTALSPYSMIRAPLRIGVARVGKVISDKQYMLTDTKQAVNIKTKLKYVKNWYAAPAESGPKGTVYMYVMLYNMNNDDVYGYASDVRFDYVSKCVYTDA